MVLFADGFWVIKNLNDTIAVFGFLLTMFSIWLTWWLARRDIEKRLRIAQTQTVDRLAGSLLQPDVVETSRCLREAREACRGKRWERAIDRCEEAKHRIPRFRFLPGLSEEDGVALDRAADQLGLLVRQLEEITAPDKKRAELTSAKVKDLDDLIQLLAAMEGKIRANGLR